MILAGGEAAEVLEAPEALLDPVAMPVGGGSVRDWDLVIVLSGNHPLGAHGRSLRAQGVAVIGLVRSPAMVCFQTMRGGSAIAAF